MDEKSEAVPDMVRSCRQSSFKKKNGKNHVPSNDGNYVKGFLFCIGRDGPNLYKNTMDHLAIHSSTQFKNGGDCGSVLMI